MAEEKDKNNKGGTGSDKVEGESKQGGKSVTQLSQEIKDAINSYFNKNSSALFLHISEGQEGLTYLDQAAVCSQLASMYACEIVCVDDKTTAIAISPKDGNGNAKYDLTYQNYNETPKLPEENGEWEGTKGNSIFKYNPNSTGNVYPPGGPALEWGPKEGESSDHPETITGVVNALMTKHNRPPVDNLVTYKDNYPDFDNCNLGEVKADLYSLDRKTNFRRAEELMAEKLNAQGKTIKTKNGERPIRPSDVRRFMKGKSKDNDVRLTWHETPDGRLQKVPSVLHGNAPHSGGVSNEKKNVNKAHDLAKGQSRALKPTKLTANQTNAGNGVNVLGDKGININGGF